MRSAKNSRFLCSGIIVIMLTETPSKAEYVTYYLGVYLFVEGREGRRFHVEGRG